MAKLKRSTPPAAPKTPRARTLRLLRAERELTQQTIAGQAGLTQTRYWQIEHGQGAPVRRWERVGIARVLELPPTQIAWPPMQVTPQQISRAEAQEKRRQLIASQSL